MGSSKHRRHRDDRGYAMAALLVAMTVMAIVMATAMPTWRTMMKREREAELVFRGEQYGRAIAMFQRATGNAMPPNIDVLIERKFLRKKFKDPMTGEDFQIITPGMPLPGQSGVQFDTSGRGGRGGLSSGPPVANQGGFSSAAGSGGRQTSTPLGASVVGVASKSTETSLRLYNGRDKYNEWVFMGTQVANTAGAGGNNSNQPGQINQNGRGNNNPDGRGANPFDALRGGGAGGRGNRGAGRGGQPPPAQPPGPRSPFGGGRSPF
jgi:type II secretory pathway pseudopilin PulG